MADEPLVLEEVRGEAPSAAPEPPAPAAPPPEEEVARLREENARLVGENRVLREPPREPAPRPAAAIPSADPYAAEFRAIETQYADGKITDAERTMRLGALGAEAALARQADEARAATAKTRTEQARQRSGQKIAVYLTRHPGLQNPAGAEMRRVTPHLHAVSEELDLPHEDERVQALALERTFGPIDRSPHVDTREFERPRHPAGGGGGTFGDEPPAPEPAKSLGERIWDKLLPEFQGFYLQVRGSKAAALKTLQYADEHEMRRHGRFK